MPVSDGQPVDGRSMVKVEERDALQAHRSEGGEGDGRKKEDGRMSAVGKNHVQMHAGRDRRQRGDGVKVLDAWSLL